LVTYLCYFVNLHLLQVGDDMQLLNGPIFNIISRVFRGGFLIEGLFMLLVGSVVTYSSVNMVEGVQTQATVTAVEELCRVVGKRGFKKISEQVVACNDIDNIDAVEDVGYTYTEMNYASLQFEDRANAVHTVKVPAFLVGRVRIGEQLAIGYDPAKPQSATPVSTMFWVKILGPVMMVAGLGLLAIWWSLRMRKSNASITDVRAATPKSGVLTSTTTMSAATPSARSGKVGSDRVPVRPVGPTTGGAIRADRLARALKTPN
jgi:hypothetical protein